jgi:phosphatidylserine/phosphatidylglycerophosphate/cardiolipin synthase-like enzyme
MIVKSIFVLPFSVMHPKFMVIDRKIAVLPSCNVSWEDWFEGSMILEGDIVRNLLNFYFAFWERTSALPPLEAVERPPGVSQTLNAPKTNLLALVDFSSIPSMSEIPAVLLPSPHNTNPRFRPFLPAAAAALTPLTTFLLSLFAIAENHVHIQTPNITSPPVLDALISALERGVNVRITTSRRMMLLEQILTAGTTTEICIWKLRRRYKKLLKAHTGIVSEDGGESGRRKPGTLLIRWFKPKNKSNEPVKSHLKMTTVDGNILVLGSGNMDRASWYTSQELGIAFAGPEITATVDGAVEEALRGRLE